MHSGMYVHVFSYHPLHVKRSIASLFLRALRICDPPFLDEEIDFLRQSFSKLGYPSHILDSSLSHAKRKFYRSTPPKPSPDLPILSLPFTTELTSLQRPLRPHCKLVFRQTNTLRRNLVRTSPASSTHSGTYSIPCSSCDLQYFGETGASLRKRITQHKYAVSRGHENNALFQHQWQTGHRIDWDGARLIFPSTDVHSRRLVESSLIRRLPNFNLNLGFSAVDNFLATYILRLLPIATQNFRPPDPT